VSSPAYPALVCQVPRSKTTAFTSSTKQQTGFHHIHCHRWLICLAASYATISSSTATIAQQVVQVMRGYPGRLLQNNAANAFPLTSSIYCRHVGGL
jgi:hypothetical protein